jgi:hypothetical protein
MIFGFDRDLVVGGGFEGGALGGLSWVEGGGFHGGSRVEVGESRHFLWEIAEILQGAAFAGGLSVRIGLHHEEIQLGVGLGEGSVSNFDPAVSLAVGFRPALTCGKWRVGYEFV